MLVVEISQVVSKEVQDNSSARAATASPRGTWASSHTEGAIPLEVGREYLDRAPAASPGAND